jgi:hypothetical protein
MGRVNYFDIISNIPYGDEIDYLEAEMRIAERDYFCKPRTFIKELTQAIEDVKILISKDSEKEKERINNEIKNPGSWEYMYLYERGLNSSNVTDEQVQRAREYNEQRTDEYIKERLAELEKVNSDTLNQIAILDIWKSKVNKLKRIIQKADNHEPQQQVDGKWYEVDITLFKTIYKYCQGKGMFNIDEAEFLERIATADLSGEIYNKGNKTKIRVLIKMIARFGVINESWYTDVVESLGISKNECTKPLNYKFESDLEAIIKEWRKLQSKYQKEVKYKLKALNPT